MPYSTVEITVRTRFRYLDASLSISKIYALRTQGRKYIASGMLLNIGSLAKARHHLLKISSAVVRFAPRKKCLRQMCREVGAFEIKTPNWSQFVNAPFQCSRSAALSLLRVNSDTSTLVLLLCFTYCYWGERMSGRIYANWIKYMQVKRRATLHLTNE